MAFFVLVTSAFFALSAVTALRPARCWPTGRYPFALGWLVGELPVPILTLEFVLVASLAVVGWPRNHWLAGADAGLATVVVVTNALLIFSHNKARTVVANVFTPSSPERFRPRHLRWWRTAFGVVRPSSARHVIRDVAYGPDPRQRLDVWRMTTTPRGAPVLIYFHGGSWVSGSRRQPGPVLLHEFVAQGWIVVNVDYRLAPAHPWPAAINDAVRALGWVKKSIAAFGGDPDRIVVSGGSAGGQLAALVALGPERWCPPDVTGVANWHVRGCISLYGVLEMTGDEHYWHGKGAGLRVLLENRVIQRSFADDPELFRAASPLDNVGIDAPPFLVVHGTHDVLVDVGVAQEFVRRFIDRALAPVYYLELPLAQHAFDLAGSIRSSATTHAALLFATSVSEPEPSLSPALLANYQSPPVEVLVEVADDQWRQARSVARQRGPFFVVTPDNPFSQSHDTNHVRRAALGELLAARRWTTLPSVNRDPLGHWPSEHGWAIFDVDQDVAHALARAFGQHAFYAVTENACTVVATKR